MSRRTYPEQETWVMRAHRLAGTVYNPDTQCQYTGKALHMFPSGFGEDGKCWQWRLPYNGQPGQWEEVPPDKWRMGWWRTDGHLCGAYTMTPEEKAWIVSNPVVFRERCQRFRRWLESTKPPAKS